MASMAERARLRFEGRKLLQALADINKTPLRDILGRQNYSFLVKIRREFCIKADALGLSCLAIAKILKRSYSTVLYHLNPEMRLRKSERRVYRPRTPEQKLRRLRYSKRVVHDLAMNL